MRAQTASADLDYGFAPLKQARLDYVVQKAVEMGAGRLTPVITNRTQVRRLNLERLRANVIEAAEQCGRTALPELDSLLRLDALLADWPQDRHLFFADETGGLPIDAAFSMHPGPAALLVGPEGGFDEAERQLLLRQPFVVPISLGPRILRADTAAVAALALIQAIIGDWR